MRCNDVYAASLSERLGIGCIVDDMLRNDPSAENCETQYMSIMRWAHSRTCPDQKRPEKHTKAPTTLTQLQLGNFDKLRVAQIKDFETFARRSLRQAKEYINDHNSTIEPGHPSYIHDHHSTTDSDHIKNRVHIWGCGGGLLDQSMEGVFKEAVKELFPGIDINWRRSYKSR